MKTDIKSFILIMIFQPGIFKFFAFPHAASTIQTISATTIKKIKQVKQLSVPKVRPK